MKDVAHGKVMVRLFQENPTFAAQYLHAMLEHGDQMDLLIALRQIKESQAMPIISLFYGICITMYWNEHNPPHFHVEYAEYKATVLIQEGIIDSGYLPGKQLKLVLAWCEIHKDELMQNWELARQGKQLQEIHPLV